MPEHRLTKIPLFPLETVLFPHATLQLHIFEDSFKQLVHDCGEISGKFGIVLRRTGEWGSDSFEPFMVGTLVEITQLHRFPDGKLEIQVAGKSRFRIRNIDYSLPYLSGSVEFLSEVEFYRSADDAGLIERAETGFEEMIQHLVGQPGQEVQVIFPESASILSFSIANLLQIDNLEKQRLLEMDDTEERLTELIPAMERQCYEIKMEREDFESLRSSIVYRVGPSDLADWTGSN